MASRVASMLSTRRTCIDSTTSPAASFSVTLLVMTMSVTPGAPAPVPSGDRPATPAPIPDADKPVPGGASKPAEPSGAGKPAEPGAAKPADAGTDPDDEKADKDPYEGIAPEDLPPDLQYDADSSVSFPTNT